MMKISKETCHKVKCFMIASILVPAFWVFNGFYLSLCNYIVLNHDFQTNNIFLYIMKGILVAVCVIPAIFIVTELLFFLVKISKLLFIVYFIDIPICAFILFLINKRTMWRYLLWTIMISTPYKIAWFAYRMHLYIRDKRDKQILAVLEHTNSMEFTDSMA